MKPWLIAMIVVMILVLATGYVVYKMEHGPPPPGPPGTTFRGINGACQCDSKTLLKSGLTGGLLTSDIDPQYTMMFSFFNGCPKTLYIVGTCAGGSGRVSLLNTQVSPKQLLRQGITLNQVNAGVIWVTDNSKLLDSLRANPLSEPDPTQTLRLEMTIVKNGDGTWTNGGNISYVDATSIPALMYFGPGRIQGVDDNPDTNNKLSYTTCTQDQLMKDCPTMVSEYNTCIAPGHFCNTANKGNSNWSKICDDSTGDMSSYIKAFGLDKIDPRLTVDKSGVWTLSRYLYNNGSNFNSTQTPYELGSFYWPTPDKQGTSYSFTPDEQSRMFVGQVDSSGRIIGAPDTTQPAPSDARIKAYNTVMNGWAIARGMCDPSDVLNSCGGQNGDYMATYTQKTSDLNNYTKGINNLASNTAAWHTGKFPDNRYAKYVTEHTHLIYGFPYDEGPFGGYTSTIVPAGTKPQMCVMFCPSCSLIDDQIK
jgi:hypothetical protein